MINIDLTAVLNHVAREGADQAPLGDSTPIAVGKPDCGRGGGNQSFGPAVLAITIGIVPAMAER